jgi:hypothetical protein
MFLIMLSICCLVLVCGIRALFISVINLSLASDNSKHVCDLHFTLVHMMTHKALTSFTVTVKRHFLFRMDFAIRNLLCFVRLNVVSSDFTQQFYRVSFC